MLISSKLHAIQTMAMQFEQFITKDRNILNALFSITQLYAWTCDSVEISIDEIYTPPVKAR